MCPIQIYPRMPQMLQRYFISYLEYELNYGKCDILDSYAQNAPANVGCLQVANDGSCANCANGYVKS